jgi:hypothetical protein
MEGSRNTRGNRDNPEAKRKATCVTQGEQGKPRLPAVPGRVKIPYTLSCAADISRECGLVVKASTLSIMTLCYWLRAAMWKSYLNSEWHLS